MQRCSMPSFLAAAASGGVSCNWGGGGVLQHYCLTCCLCCSCGYSLLPAGQVGTFCNQGACQHSSTAASMDSVAGTVPAGQPLTGSRPAWWCCAGPQQLAREHWQSCWCSATQRHLGAPSATLRAGPRQDLPPCTPYSGLITPAMLLAGILWHRQLPPHPGAPFLAAAPCNRAQQGCLSSCRQVSTPAASLQEHELQGRTYTFTDPASMQAEIDAGNFLEACQVQHGAEAHLYGSSLVTVRGVASTGETTILLMPVWASAVCISPAACGGVPSCKLHWTGSGRRSFQTDMLRRTGGLGQLKSSPAHFLLSFSGNQICCCQVLSAQRLCCRQAVRDGSRHAGGSRAEEQQEGRWPVCLCGTLLPGEPGEGTAQQVRGTLFNVA